MRSTKLRLLLLLAVLATLPFQSFSQLNVLEKSISISFKNERLKNAFKQIEKNTEVQFAYSNSYDLNQKVSGSFSNQSLNNVLQTLLKDTKLSFKVIAGKVTIFEIEKPKKKSERVTIHGYIFDDESGEILIGAAIWDSKSKQGCATNSYGYYSLTLNNDSTTISVSYLGYTTHTQQINLINSTQQNFRLTPTSSLMKEVTVTSQKSKVG